MPSMIQVLGGNPSPPPWWRRISEAQGRPSARPGDRTERIARSVIAAECENGPVISRPLLIEPIPNSANGAGPNLCGAP